MECYKLNIKEPLLFRSSVCFFIRVESITMEVDSVLSLFKENPYVEIVIENEQYGVIYKKKEYLVPHFKDDYNKRGCIFIKFDDDLLNYQKGLRGFTEGNFDIKINIGANNDIHGYIYIKMSHNVEKIN